MDILEEAPRSPQWSKLAHDTVKAHPFCSGCGTKHDLDVHHVLPFSWFPQHELDPKNLLVLCHRCHLLIGHDDNWRSYNPTSVQDAAIWLDKIKNRPVKKEKDA